MSRRARLIGASADVEHFAWTQEARTGAPAVLAVPAVVPVAPAAPLPAAAPAGSAPGVPAESNGPAAPVNDDTLMAEHRERLAALEREAFTKGYAQGERAGLEAGGKRAEAMLRRVA